MNFAAWPARTGVSHLPEIIFAPEAKDFFAWRSHLCPEPLRIFIGTDFIVAAKDCEPEPPRIHLQFIHQKIPSKFERVFCEVIAERKIAEHLEKCLMPRGVSHFIQVVVLAAGAQTLLRRAGADII